jgi:HTH-type transcriptional regulator/antitoxin HigA
LDATWNWMFPTKEYRTPGQLIQELLDARGWTQRVLAIILRIDESGLNKIVAGKRSVDAELALALADIFAVPAERFLELQRTYDLAQARIITRPDPGRTNRALLFGDLPITEMIKRRWLDAEDVRDVPSVEAALMKFFGVKSIDDIEILPHAAKKTNISQPATPAQLAWLYRVHSIADDMLVARYSPEAAEDSAARLKPLRSSLDAARKVPRILAESGIRFVIVESLPSAKIDGVCLWLNDAAPVIGMTLRYDRIDNFWFVLRHELEHVIQQHGRSAAMLDIEMEKNQQDVAEEERIANDAASEFCVPRSSLNRFIERKAPIFAERDILGFAKTLGVHPGLVAGQLQHRTGRYDLYRNHLVKVRSAVAPNATVDGWGDVAPI